MFAPVYLDHNATTPLDARVLEAMLPFLRERFGNASSRHEYGRAARKAIDEARQQVAAAVGAHPTEVVCTSGGREANNLFLRGAAAGIKSGMTAPLAAPPLVAVSAIEHPCVCEPGKELQRQGWRYVEIGVDGAGRIDVDAYVSVLSQTPRLISIMLANNETGVLQDVAALAERARSYGRRDGGCTNTWFHTDAVQACGKIAVDFRALNTAGVHALSLSSHKIYGPQGAGALVLDKRVELRPLIAGGGQERGLRSGTENLAAIVGFGHACSLLAERRAQEAGRLAALRGELERGLVELGAEVFATQAERLPNTVYFAFAHLDGETLVGKLDRAGYAVASGAACSSANPEPSHVLQAMGGAVLRPELARGAVRVSLGSGNTAAQIADFLAVLGATVFKLRRLTALAG